MKHWLRSVGLLTIAAGTVAVSFVGAASADHYDEPQVRRLTFQATGETPAQVQSLEISGDGRLVVFGAGRAFVAEDTNDDLDIYLLDVRLGTFTLVSRNTSGMAPNGPSSNPRISSDGSTVAYQSTATNIVVGDNNDSMDVFAYDVASGSTTLVSRSLTAVPADGWSQSPSVSGDGTKVAFSSNASDVTAESGASFQVYALDVVTDTMTMVSVNMGGGLADNESLGPDISADGSSVAFQSRATDLVVAVDSPATHDAFVRDLASGVTQLVSVDSNGNAAQDGFSVSISGDGSRVVYVSGADDLVIDDANGELDVYLFERTTGKTSRVSAPDGEFLADDQSPEAAISEDGSIVVFPSEVLIPEGGGVRWFQVFRRDLEAGTTMMVSATVDGEFADGTSFSPAVDTDGSSVAFRSHARNLGQAEPNDAANTFDLFLWGVPNSFDDDDGSIFESDIEWLAGEGITNGCAALAFCPDDSVTRGQMAAFLNRALNLADTATDFFTDDDGTIFEDDINRLAAAGITQGCESGLFCPDDSVTRGQMAAFLNRALNLADTATDFFTDDDGTIFEDDINRLAAAGITQGCKSGLFCPDDSVTRGQMAAFLHRALG